MEMFDTRQQFGHPIHQADSCVIRSQQLHASRPIGDVDIRTLSGTIGISPATLSRIENGKACDAGTLVKIWRWLTDGRDE